MKPSEALIGKGYAEPLVTQVIKFQDIFASGMMQVVEACNIYADTVDKFPEAREAFREACPTVPECVWARIELVGIKAMHPKLLWATGRVAGKLRKLPLSTQTKCLEEGLELLIANGESLKVASSAMTQFQIRQVFADSHLRTLAEQRAWLESYKAENNAYEPVAGDLDKCIIKDKTFIVREAMTFTRAQLQKVLDAMDNTITVKKKVVK